jgi:exosome complex component RRP4
MSISFHPPIPRAATDKVHRRGKKYNVEHDMDLDGDHEDTGRSAMKDPLVHVVTPGQVITSDTAFMR